MSAFRHGIGMLVAGAKVPVIPCHLRGTFEALPPGAKWPRRGRISLRIGTTLNFENIPNERNGWRSVADALEEVVRGLAAKD